MQLLIVIIILIAIVFGGVQTPPGKRMIANTVQSNVSFDGFDRIEIENISGIVPFDMRVDAVRIRDSESDWLEIRDIVIKLNAGALLGGQVYLREVSSATVDVRRAPVFLEEPEPEPWRLPEVPRLPDFIRLDAFAVDELVLGEELLGEAGRFGVEAAYRPGDIAGEQVLALTLNRLDDDTTEARIRIVGSPESLNIDANVRDSVYVPKLMNTEEPFAFELAAEGPFTAWDGELSVLIGEHRLAELTATLRGDESTEFQLTGAIDLQTSLVDEAILEQVGGRFDVKLDGALSRDGLLSLNAGTIRSDLIALSAAGDTHLEHETVNARIDLNYTDLARVLNPPEPKTPMPLAAQIQTEGTWSELTSTIQATLADDFAIDLALNSRIDTIIQLDTTGSVRIPAVLVDTYDLPEGMNDFAVEIRASYDQDTGTYIVEPSTIQHEHFTVNTHLESRPNENVLAAELAVELLDSAILNSLIEQELSLLANAKLNIASDNDQTDATLQIVARDLSIDDLGIDTVDLSLNVNGGSLFDDIAERWTVALSGETSAIHLGEDTFEAVRVSVDANRAPDTPIQLSNLTVNQGPTDVSATGTIDPSFELADLELRLGVSDVHPYAQLGEQNIHAGITANATMAYRANADEMVTGRLTTRVTDLAGVSELVDDLLSSGAELDMEYAVGEDAATATGLTLSSEDWSVTGKGSYNWTDEIAQVNAGIDVNLEAIAKAVDELPAGGRASATVVANLDGDQIDATTDLTIEDGFYDTRSIDAFSLSSVISGTLDALKTMTQLDVTVDGRELNGDFDVTYAGDRVELASVEIVSGQNRIQSTGWWSTDGTHGEAELTIAAPALDELAAFVDQQLAGRAEGNVYVTSEDEVLNAVADLTFDDVVSGSTSFAQGTLRVDANDLLGDGRGDASLVLSNVSSGELRVASLESNVGFTSDGIDVTATSEGRVTDGIPWDVTLETRLNLENSELVLSKLDGHLEEYPLKLERNATVSWADEIYSVDQLNLSFGTGTIAASARVTNDDAVVNGEWNSIPLEALRLAGLPFVEGTGQGSIALSGPRDTPSGTATLRLTGAKTRQMSNVDTGANLTADLNLTPTQVTLTSQADLSPESRVTLTAAVPLILSEETVYALQGDGNWTGDLNGTIDLADVPKLLDTPEHVIDGVLQLAAKLGGSPDDPMYNANAVLSGGRYENADMGTVLQDMELEVDANQDRIEIARLFADDGSGGTLEGTGRLDFDDASGFEYSSQLELTDVRLVHRDDITGRISAELFASGDEEASDITGELLIEQANLIVRPSSQETVSELDVRYVNDPRYTEESTTEQKPASTYVVNLDIQSTFPGRVFVQAQDVFTEWEGDLRIFGTTANPLVTGQLQPVRGHISFLGRRFTLDQESLVSVNTETNSAPYLNLSATTRRSGVTGRLNIRGTLDELDFSLTSEPPLPQEEVLSRVLFGRGVSELSPIQGLQLARAVAILSGKFEGVPFLSGPSRLPIVDTFDVSSGESGPTVSVGKYISDRVFVEMEPGNSTDGSRMKVQIDATNYVALESVVGTGNQTGMGVFFKYHY